MYLTIYIYIDTLCLHCMDVKKSLPGRFHVAMADVKTGRCLQKPMVAESTFSKRETSLMESIHFFQFQPFVGKCLQKQHYRSV